MSVLRNRYQKVCPLTTYAEILGVLTHIILRLLQSQKITAESVIYIAISAVAREKKGITEPFV